jgi:septation ring formation regulator EzrA
MGTISFDFNFWTLTLLLMNFALALFVALSNRHKAAAEELQSVKKSLQVDIKGVQDDVKSIDHQVHQQGQRLSAIEADVENGISKEDLSVVHRRMDKVLETVGPLEGRLDEISKNMSRIDQHLIQLLQKR